jgi:hypothetical protein
MGRKKLNRPQDELDQERRDRQMRYYGRNKERLNKKRLEYYYKTNLNKDESH